jgi:nitrogen-specific signal transduction histidine kinase
MEKLTTLYHEWQPAEEETSLNIYPAVAKKKPLHLVGTQGGEKATKELILDGVLHELQNCLQSIGMGVDLLQLSQPDELECQSITSGIERASRLLREMQEYFFPPDPYISTKNLGDMLSEAIQKITIESGRENIRLQCPESLPSIHYDWFMLSRVLERVLRCACGLLSSEGGESVVSARVQETQSQAFVEIKVEICGTNELVVEEEKIFTPCWRAHDYRAGLGLVLARQAMQSRNGALTFKKINSSRAQFTLHVSVLPESIVSRKTGKEIDNGCVEG